MPQLTVNPRLKLTGFRTTRPRPTTGVFEKVSSIRTVDFKLFLLVYYLSSLCNKEEIRPPAVYASNETSPYRVTETQVKTELVLIIRNIISIRY